MAKRNVWRKGFSLRHTYKKLSKQTTYDINSRLINLLSVIYNKIETVLNDIKATS